MITGVRDEEKERYDRKSLALSPPPASPETCSTHPQHSGLAPPPWIRSVSLLCFHAFPCPCFLSLPVFAAPILSITYSVHLKHILSHPLSLCYRFIAAFSVYIYNFVVFSCCCGYSYIAFCHFSLLNSLALSHSFLYLCSLPLLCVCIILSLALAHSHPPPSHTRVEHKQAAA